MVYPQSAAQQRAFANGTVRAAAASKAMMERGWLVGWLVGHQ